MDGETVDRIVEECQYIFRTEYLMDNFPVLSYELAYKLQSIASHQWCFWRPRGSSMFITNTTRQTWLWWTCGWYSWMVYRVRWCTFWLQCLWWQWGTIYATKGNCVWYMGHKILVTLLLLKIFFHVIFIQQWKNGQTFTII